MTDPEQNDPPADEAEILDAIEVDAVAHRIADKPVLPADEAVARLNQRDAHSVVIAEMNDVYGDMGRCGILHLTPDREGEALIESLAISCRTRARGLSLAMLVGLLTHPNACFDQYRCRYVFNGSNRPLRLLLMGIGFKSLPDTEELTLSAHQLAQVKLPDWVQIRYETRAQHGART